jgi:hypothetical protein
MNLKIAAMFVVLALPGLAAAENAAAPAEKASDKPVGNSVSLKVEGCNDKCAEFEISLFDNGRLLFTPSGTKNSTDTPVSKNGMKSIYNRVAKYVQDSGALNESAECTSSKPDSPFATVQSSQNGQVQKAKWSAGCANQIEKARSLVKVFVNQTGFWRDINHDSRYWEKYWETWEYPGESKPPLPNQ